MEANGKSKTARGDSSICINEISFEKDIKKTKSVLSLSRCSTPHQQSKIAIGKCANGGASSTSAKAQMRNFRFSSSPMNNSKKIYMKNSDKTIKPPEKSDRRSLGGVSKEPQATPSASTAAIKGRTVFLRSGSQLSSRVVSNTSEVNTSVQPITGNVESTVVPAYARVDSKTINDLEKRLENLQSILFRKVEILRNRDPEKVKREYKFVAMIVGDESKLMVKDDDARRIPSSIPAKSVEDLNRKAEEFFRGCLLSFIDKLRNYESEGRSINCDAIYEDLKNDEKEFCRILQDWITEFCDDSEVTLTEAQLMLNKDVVERKIVTEQEAQTDDTLLDLESAEEKADKEEELNELRQQLFELKERLAELTEIHRDELEALELKHDEKHNELITSWQKEQAQLWAKEEEIIKARKNNEDLSQQILDLEERIKYLTEKNEQLSAQLKRESDAKAELSKYRDECHRVQEENDELKEMKTHFLKKLDQRYMRIELQEKEIKMQKRTIQAKNNEIDQLKTDFNSKVKENRQNKESLEARSKLIEHLRTALEIDQRKIREYESMLEAKARCIAQQHEELEEKNTLLQLAKHAPKEKRLRTSPPRVEQIYGISPHKRSERATKRTAEKSLNHSSLLTRTDELSIETNRTNDISHGFQLRATDRPKKPFSKSSGRDNGLPMRSEDTISLDVTGEFEPPFQRHTKSRKRSRDIVVKKYEI